MNAFYITIIIIIVYCCWILSSLDEVNKKLWTHNNYWSSYKQLQVRHVAEIFPLCYLLVSDSCGVFNCLCERLVDWCFQNIIVQILLDDIMMVSGSKGCLKYRSWDKVKFKLVTITVLFELTYDLLYFVSGALCF